MKGDNNMKCNVWFVLAKSYYWNPADATIESYYVKGSSIEDCQKKAWSKLKSDYHSLTIQEINVKVVKK